LILAVYDNNGKLIKIEKEAATLTEGDNKKTFLLNTIPDGKYMVKIFCWDNIASMVPLANPAVCTLN
jgi:hypothetical protein